MVEPLAKPINTSIVLMGFAALCPCYGLRRPHDYRRKIPARRLAALPSRSIHRRDQDRHIMIDADARQNYRAASLLR
jgi:hypothetical protein